MKILLIGPGIMPIPSEGWGAVERVVWGYYRNLKRKGIKVEILNKVGLIAALRSKFWDKDVIHLHYDELASFWYKLCRIFGCTNKLVITTHYGYASNPDLWEISYKKIFKDIKEIPTLFALSKELKNSFMRMGYKKRIYVLPNGTNVNEYRYIDRGDGKAVCIGKIEPRKRQIELAKLVNSSKCIKCDFYGPTVVPIFSNTNFTKYLGPIKESKLKNILTEYSCLVLASKGEAHALVILEAMAAGLSVVVSKSASANLPRRPWVRIVNDMKDFPKEMEKAAIENYKYRKEIHDYVKNNYDWDIICKEYLSILKEKVLT